MLDFQRQLFAKLQDIKDDLISILEGEHQGFKDGRFKSTAAGTVQALAATQRALRLLVGHQVLTGEAAEAPEPDAEPDEAPRATRTTPTGPIESRVNVWMDERVAHGLIKIINEREWQVIGKGGGYLSPQHDDGELAKAAACYAIAACQLYDPSVTAVTDSGHEHRTDLWPWAPGYDKRNKHSEEHCLEIAGALIAAELDRRRRRTK